MMNSTFRNVLINAYRSVNRNTLSRSQESRYLLFRNKASSTLSYERSSGTRTRERNFDNEAPRQWNSNRSPSYGASSSNNKYGNRRVGGGGGRTGYRPPSDPFARLTFKTTIKIDPEQQTPLEDMKISSTTLKILQSKGFTKMTPVQSQSYDPVFAGDDVVARSRTGTGKTFAFGVPLIEKIVQEGYVNKPAAQLPVILILEPTRELALQVQQELNTLCRPHKVKVTSVFGQSSFDRQVESFRNGVHIVVGTPGRLLDHISRGTLNLGHVKHVVLDEGDTMLEMGFQKDVESILMAVKQPGLEAQRKARRALESPEDFLLDDDESSSNKEDNYADGEVEEGGEGFLQEMNEMVGSKSGTKSSLVNSSGRDGIQLLLFSATMPAWICTLTDRLMNEPIFLDAVQEGETRLASTITHYSMLVQDTGNRVQAIGNYIEDLILTKGEGGQTIVFTSTKEEADRLASTNAFGSLRVQALHGDISQQMRQTTLRNFREKKIEVLVATDVAARGLDIAGVDLVLHTAAPNDPDSYVHRSGRTGRAGRPGTSILFYSPDEERRLRDFQRQLNFKFQRIGPPSANEVVKASAIVSEKKLNEVDEEVVEHFIPHAQDLIERIKDGKYPLAVNDVEVEDNETEEGTSISTEQKDPEEQLANVLARCLAALSNRKSLMTRSLLTGQPDLTTLQVKITLRSRETPQTVPDLQRILEGFLRKKLMMEDHKYNKMQLAKDANGEILLLVDFDKEIARTIIEKCEAVEMQGIEIKACQELPQLVESENNYYRGSSGGSGYNRGSSGGYSGGGGYNRGGGGGGYNRSGGSSDGPRKSWQGKSWER